MSDPAFQWLLTMVSANSGQHALWFLDENADESWEALTPNPNIQLLSNRWDLADKAQRLGWNSRFADLALTQQADNSLDRIYYRISKEKPLVHALFNQAWRCLKPEGRLLLAGLKNEGTKTYIDKLAKLWNTAKDSQKLGLAYVAELSKSAAFDANKLLDSSDYQYLREITTPDEVTRHLGQLKLYSKPGQFGWNKVDQGSWLLIQHLAEFVAQSAPRRCLDLGCGYGFLSLAASRIAQLQSINHWHLTDNNAAALLSARHNMSQLNLPAGASVEVTGDDCGANISDRMDLIICNPPFHQGFSLESELTDRFLHSCKRLLAPRGRALFVVNQFIPVERKAEGLFTQVKTLCNNGSFKLVGLANS